MMMNGDLNCVEDERNVFEERGGQGILVTTNYEFTSCRHPIFGWFHSCVHHMVTCADGSVMIYMKCRVEKALPNTCNN